MAKGGLEDLELSGYRAAWLRTQWQFRDFEALQRFKSEIDLPMCWDPPGLCKQLCFVLEQELSII